MGSNLFLGIKTRNGITISYYEALKCNIKENLTKNTEYLLEELSIDKLRKKK